MVIDRRDPCLACSPDGLIEDDGLVEIKCPFSIRFENPSECIKTGKLKYFNKNGGLKKSHNYNYQIQGQLNILKRQWCDVAIWTHVGIHIKRIWVDVEFWNEIVEKLTTFYLYYLLPELVNSYPNNIVKRKWTVNLTPKPCITEDAIESNKLIFLENGLVSNRHYYSICKNYNNYVVCRYGTALVAEELKINDFISLDKKTG